MTQKVSVVIPTLKEEQNVAWVLDRLPAGARRGSSSSMAIGRPQPSRWRYAARPDAPLILEPVQARARTLRAGFGTPRAGLYIVMPGRATAAIDRPGEIIRFLDALATVATWSRAPASCPTAARPDMTRVRKAGERHACGLVNALYGCGSPTSATASAACAGRPLVTLGLSNPIGFEMRPENSSSSLSGRGCGCTEVPELRINPGATAPRTSTRGATAGRGSTAHAAGTSAAATRPGSRCRTRRPGRGGGRVEAGL